ncbi:SDR family oxidoreductase [Alloyangia pacifica]|uniref:NAD(P)-dependent dehydrogenase, short-chain alcohol dehydrogenase family n=1 Tax=Alloyangia pacifica TaxID=311180 RepID=A0A1I6W346_9RHOB|nr:SDR family oxidoreductase [Alloyangia pacifica]SDI39037.1 NAD(P)-dependent dehydrogenase, short-chain alcohol dehydrogenase family [Alloyangia pacifica]SFT20131.1 NAD(P)-dependent dehydrogenase, short-chain alcohol dehydrogenase family [Alloyangia pacifica]
MKLELEGARVIVTAGAQGIGRAIVEGFLAEGARVATCDIDEAALASLPSEVWRQGCDVSDAAQIGAFMQAAIAELGGLDVLVNNAGIAGPTGPVEELAPEDWDQCLNICLTSQFHCVRHAVPALRESANASIINLSSMAGRVGFALRTPYAAAKWGVIGFTKSLSIELGKDGIRANAILPGIVAGDRQRRVLEAKAQRLGKTFEEVEAAAFSYTSLKEYVSPEQIADQILFLASPRGRTISGQAISVCGDGQMLA